MKSRPIVVGLGEVLWDVFPDGPRFGGAPANFACSSAGLGQEHLDVFLVSAVGNDELGRLAVQALDEHQVNTAALARDRRPTGQVLVTLDREGRPSYEFATNSAWDHLAWNDSLAQLAAQAAVVCFGTLGQRGEISRATIRRFVNHTSPQCLRLLDLNLRPPYGDDEVVLHSLGLASALKLNDAELPSVARLLALNGPDAEVCRQILDRYSYRFVALTRGAQGALLISARGEVSDFSGISVDVVDTVGAGDSFTSCLAIGELRQMTLDGINRWANEVAAFVCTQPGATPRLPQELCLGSHRFA